MRITVINGLPRAGKDTFVDLCSRGPYRVMNVSSVDEVKRAAEILGWDGVKDEKGRQFLSDLKDMSSRDYKGPLNYMLGRIEEAREAEYDHVFLHIREPEEISELVEAAGADTLLLKRGVEETFGNHADRRVENYVYDVVIANDGSLGDLWVKAVEYMEEKCD